MSTGTNNVGEAWRMKTTRAGSAYMDARQTRAAEILARFAAGVNHAHTRDAQIKAVIGIANEVERHANAIDPREVTAVSVLVDLTVELAQAVRHIANIMDADDHPAPIIVDGPEWPVSLMDEEAGE